MHIERHMIDITGWTKEQIFLKIKEIFYSGDSILFIKIDARNLEYEILTDRQEITTKNPSMRNNQ